MDFQGLLLPLALKVAYSSRKLCFFEVLARVVDAGKCPGGWVVGMRKKEKGCAQKWSDSGECSCSAFGPANPSEPLIPSDTKLLPENYFSDS